MRRRPWGALSSTAAAAVFAAPTLFLPADTPVAPKLIFILAGSVLFATAVVFTRTEPGASSSGESSEDVSP